MSRKYDIGDRIPNEVLASRLDELSDALTKRGEDWQREFTMRIPAELDRDADLVMAEAAKRLREMGSD